MDNEKFDTVGGSPISESDQKLIEAVDLAIVALAEQFLNPLTHDRETIHHNAHGIMAVLEHGLNTLRSFTASTFCGAKMEKEGVTFDDATGKFEIADESELPPEIREMVKKLNESGAVVKVAKLKGSTPNIPFSGKLNA